MFLNDHKNFLELLGHRAIEKGNEPAFTFLNGAGTEPEPLTYIELETAARSIASELQSHGLTGKQVLLLYPPGLDFIRAFFACIYAGAIAVPVYPPLIKREAEHIRNIAKDAECSALLSTAPFINLLRHQISEELSAISENIIETDQIPLDAAASWKPNQINLHDVAYLQYTSGSTGRPKGLMISHENIRRHEEMWGSHEMNQIPEYFEGRYRMLNWLPLYHDMGLVANVLRPVFLHVPSYHMSPLTMIKDPTYWLEMISEYDIVASGGPNFAYDLTAKRASMERLEGADLSNWKFAYIGADKVHADTLERFVIKFNKLGFDSRTFYPCYGLAEATLQVTAIRAEDEYHSLYVSQDHEISEQNMDGRSQLTVGCGSPCSGIEIRIVDPETCEIQEDGKIGEIWISSIANSLGYWKLPELTSEVFKATFLGDSSGTEYLRSGDLGFVRDNNLFITGRLKDLIIIRGKNYYPDDLEQVAESAHPFIRPGCTVAFSIEEESEECLIIVSELKNDVISPEDEKEITKSIHRALMEKASIRVSQVDFVAKGEVPKTSSGKLQRNEAKRRKLQNLYECLSA